MRVCPFCQSKKLTIIKIDPNGLAGYRVNCVGTKQLCGALGPKALTKEEAEEKWDYRPIPQRIEMALLKGEKV